MNSQNIAIKENRISKCTQNTQKRLWVLRNGFVKLASLVGGKGQRQRNRSGLESRKCVRTHYAKDAVEPGFPGPARNPEVWPKSDAKGAGTPPSSANQDEVRREFGRI